MRDGLQRIAAIGKIHNPYHKAGQENFSQLQAFSNPEPKEIIGAYSNQVYKITYARVFRLAQRAQNNHKEHGESHVLIAK